jgi:hypothetical protein
MSQVCRVGLGSILVYVIFDELGLGILYICDIISFSNYPWGTHDLRILRVTLATRGIFF